MDKQIRITTNQILSLAYCTIFGIMTNNGSGFGHYYGQYAGDSCIDYAYFDGHNEQPFDDDSDFFEAVTEDGCEGCWIRVERVRYTGNGYERKRCGTIKTLDDGRNAWRNMGQLAGELSYVANNEAARKVVKRAMELAAEAHNLK